MAKRLLVCVSVCAASLSSGRRVQQSRDLKVVDSQTVPETEAIKDLASMLLTANPDAAFSAVGRPAPRAKTRVAKDSRPASENQMVSEDEMEIAKSLFSGATADLARADAVLMCTQEPLDKKQKESVETVTEKYGLEAGLFSLFKNRGDGDTDKKSSMDKAKELLKKYGGAYLLTSTSLAAVSFGLCYLAVDNGIDVGALLSKVNIQVSQNTETASTVGIAYAIHKAASPIRFPPTVALTPIVAKEVFGREAAEEEKEEEKASA